MKTVVVLGKGTLAIKIAQWFHDSPDYLLSAVVPVFPEPDWTDSFADWAKAKHVRMYQHYRDIIPMHIDLAFSVYYDKILPVHFLSHYKLALNLHNAPLPKYRGVRPINWALKNGEHKHGVTVHEITANIDGGDIYGQVMFSIDPKTDEVRDVYNRCLEHGWNLFLEVINSVDIITPQIQDEEKATYYTADDAELLWERAGWTREESMPEYFRQLKRTEFDFADYLEKARGNEN